MALGDSQVPVFGTQWSDAPSPTSAQKTSGQNENDVMKLALDMYFNDYKHKFTMEHAWRELRHDQKWGGSGSSKKRRTDAVSVEGTDAPFSHGEDEGVPRPAGVKASKAKKTTKTNSASLEEDGKGLVEFRSIWELREKELALKDKTNKQKILENLLAKTDSLSDVEVELKNKLINEMLSNM
ncbi:glutathione S-transferase T2-like [Eutrema salsugineum]|uniref:glutathione S-transferase T2-like n=1 Tax=Eutrema salsugineum TaxID=72664 RepID=UPI000CED3F8D|nr:glutathione S-transferase T2-like [Eutrema salsugineum]